MVFIFGEMKLSPCCKNNLQNLWSVRYSRENGQNGNYFEKCYNFNILSIWGKAFVERRRLGIKFADKKGVNLKRHLWKSLLQVIARSPAKQDDMAISPKCLIGASSASGGLAMTKKGFFRDLKKTIDKDFYFYNIKFHVKTSCD